MSLKEIIHDFNGMYGLPAELKPVIRDTIQGVRPEQRLTAFSNILTEECDELLDVRDQVMQFTNHGADTVQGVEDMELDCLTALADLLADVTVYCRSEALKFGIPLEDVLEIVMQSNMSKLGADGNPILDERGKVMKGPGYWKPEPRIRELLAARRAETEGQADERVRLELEHGVAGLARGLIMHMGSSGFALAVDAGFARTDAPDVPLGIAVQAAVGPVSELTPRADGACSCGDSACDDDLPGLREVADVMGGETDAYLAGIDAKRVPSEGSEGGDPD